MKGAGQKRVDQKGWEKGGAKRGEELSSKCLYKSGLDKKGQMRVKRDGSINQRFPPTRSSCLNKYMGSKSEFITTIITNYNIYIPVDVMTNFRQIF